MSNIKTFWQPAGDLSDAQAQALSVMAGTKPDPGIYPYLLVRKLQQLIDLLPKQEAQDVMEMSLEYLPEIYMIAKDQNREHWAQALANSDTMHSLIARMDWSLPGQQIPEPSDTSLQSLLEQLP